MVPSQVLAWRSEPAKPGLSATLPGEEWEVQLVEKELTVRPLGRARDGGPGLRLGFRSAMFAS
jgi:hypothetical protein